MFDLGSEVSYNFAWLVCGCGCVCGVCMVEQDIHET